MVLQTLGYDYVRDIEPGEAILIKNTNNQINNYIDNELKIVNKVILQKEKAHCMFEWIYFARPDSMIEKEQSIKQDYL